MRPYWETRCEIDLIDARKLHVICAVIQNYVNLLKVSKQLKLNITRFINN